MKMRTCGGSVGGGLVLTCVILSLWLGSSARVSAWVTGWTLQVMDVEQGAATAYDLSAVYLGPNPTTGVPTYFVTFHAEAYDGGSGQKPKGWGCWGDSVGYKYSSSPYGANVFGTHYYNQDMLITRTSAASEYLESPTCSSPSGAANPTLLVVGGGSPFWSLYYISGREEGGVYRNYLMPALVEGSSLFNISSATMFYLDRSSSAPAYCGSGGPGGTPCYPGDAWTALGPVGGRPALVYRNMPSARPAHQVPFSYTPADRLQSTNIDTLMGSFSYDSTGSNLYWYYVNLDSDGHHRLHRRTSTNPSWVTEFGVEDQGFVPKDLGSETPMFRVNYDSTYNKWVVLYSCYRSDPSRGVLQDICMQLFNDASLTGFVWGKFDANQPSPNLGIGISTDPCVSCTSGSNTFNSSRPYWITQFNIRKNGYGHHFTDSYAQVIVYFSAAADVLGTGNPYYQRVYAKLVNIQ